MSGGGKSAATARLGIYRGGAETPIPESSGGPSPPRRTSIPMNLRLTLSSRRSPPRRGLVVLVVLVLALISLGRATSDARAATGDDYSGLTLYLSNAASSPSVLGSGSWQLVTGAPASVSTLTQNRITLNGVGYQDFQPGIGPGGGNSALVTCCSLNSKGWIVDGAGGVSFAPGQWSFQAKVLENWGGAGAASLAVGMWAVKVVSGAIDTPSARMLIDPSCSTATCPSGAKPGDMDTPPSFITSSGTASVSVSASLGAVALASGEHLYVQLWRHQTLGINSVGTPQRLATLSVNDGFAEITHPAATALPNLPSLGAVAARVNATPAQLTATYSDPVDSGTVSIELCGDSNCTNVLQGGPFTSGTLTDAQSWSWSPAALSDGAYWWSARAQDSSGDQSAWTTPTEFIVDTTPADVPALGAPVDLSRVNSSTLHAAFTDSVSHGSGSVEFKLCTNPLCTILATGDFTSATVADGSAAAWTPSVPDGQYYWQARSIDNTNNQSGWSAIHSFVLDTNPPGIPTLGAPADGSYLGAPPALHATFSSSDAGDSGTVTFQVCSDPACGAGTVQATGSVSSLTNGITGIWTPTGLADGVHYWRAQAQDAAGNQQLVSSPAAQSFTLDTTNPSVPPLGTVAARTRTTPQLSATFTDPGASDSGTLVFQLCANSSCTTMLQTHTASAVANNTPASWTPTSLADGTYYWRVSATDTAANPSGWSATSSFVVDTVAPGLPAFASPANGARVNVAQLNANFTDSDPADSGTVTFQLCSDAACSTVLTSSTSAAVAGGAGVSWTPGGVADGTYYWRLSGTDVAGNAGAWTATRRFVLDTNPPAVPSLAGPAVGAHIGSRPDLGGTFTTGDNGDSGSLSFQVCADSGCTSVVQTGSSSSGLSSGTTGTWATASLADGVYYWRARATDVAGNPSAWSASESFTVDTVPPSAPSASGLADGKLLDQAPTLTSSYTDPTTGGDSGSLVFEVCTTNACTTLLRGTAIAGLHQNDAGSWTPSALADGTYYWHVRAEDSAGNLSPWSAVRSFSIDGTPPPAPALSTASGERVHTAPQLGATVIEPSNPGDSSRLLVELCTDPACTSIITTGYSGVVSVDTAAGWQAPQLADGVYYWRALAEDAAGNQSPWSAVGSFVVDTVPPAVPVPGGPAVGAIVNTPVLTGVPGTSATGVAFQVCADAACATVLTGGYAVTPASGAAPSWTPTGLADGTYFWRIAAHDEAGSASGWSETKSFVLDQTPPGTPRALQAKVTGKTLTLHWLAPSVGHHLAGYAVFANGKRIRTLTLKTRTVRITLHKSETRVFTVASFDAAGNVSRPTRQVAAVSLPLANRAARAATPPVAHPR